VERERHTPVKAQSRQARATLMRADTRELAAIFIGGCLGAGMRAGLSQTLPVHAGSWPWATFSVNILGALLLGWLITRLQERLPPTMYMRALLATGFCGALTTFSTLVLEVLAMLEHGDAALALSYTAASIVLGLAAVEIATKMARRGRFLG
jgi:CrcB protein